MTRELAGDLGFMLRAQLMPILSAYGVDDFEVAYSIGTDHVVEALQFRDAKGLRIPRGNIPERVTSRLESCITDFLAATNLEAGVGVVAVCFSAGRVARRHQVLDEGKGVAIEEWQL
jgi:hypothetical protein